MTANHGVKQEMCGFFCFLLQSETLPACYFVFIKILLISMIYLQSVTPLSEQKGVY